MNVKTVKSEFCKPCTTRKFKRISALASTSGPGSPRLPGMSRVENLFSPVAQAMSIQPILWMALGSSNHPLITNEQYPPSFEPRRLRGISIPRFPRESKGTSRRLTSTWEYQENLRVSGRTHKQVRSEMMALTSPKRETSAKQSLTKTASQYWPLSVRNWYKRFLAKMKHLCGRCTLL